MTALIQSGVANTSALAASSVSVTLGATPTQGNLLVAVLNLAATTVSATPWGATADSTSILAATLRTVIYSKTATAGESATVSATLSASATTHRLSVYEFSPTSGLVWAGLDKQATNTDAGTTVATLSSGTTAATTSTDGVAVAGFSFNGTFTGLTLTNGYTSLLNGNATTGHLILTATGAQETTASWTTARRVSAAIAAYKQSAAGAGSGAGFLSIL